MPKIPSYRTQKLPSTNTGAALARPVAEAGGAIGQGMVGLGNGIYNLGIQLDRIQVNEDVASGLAEYSEKLTTYELNGGRLEKNEKGELDLPKTLKDQVDQLVNSKHPQAQRILRDKLAVELQEDRLNLGGKMARERVGLVMAKSDSLFSTFAMDAEKGEQNIQDYIDSNAEMIGESNVERLKQKATRYLTKADKVRLEQAKKAKVELIDSVKPQIVDALGDDYDMEKAISFIDKSVNELQKKGLNDVDAVEAKQDLTNWANDFAEERRYKAKQQERLNVVQTAEVFTDKLIDGTFNADDIALSSLNETQKQKWMPILEGKRKDTPPATTYKGSQVVTQTLVDYSAGTIGKGEAIDKLVQERYVNQSITPDAFEFAIKRIKNPYPPHVAETINGIIGSSKNFLYHRGTGIAWRDWMSGSDKETFVKVNNSFLGWLEDESKDGKYPSGEEMYKKVRELGVTIDTPKNLPKQPLVIPKKTDPTFITTDEQYDALSSGTRFYDGIFGVWRVKP